MTFPYTYWDLQEYLDNLDLTLNEHPDIYYKRESLIPTYEGRRVELLTISSYTAITAQFEDRLHQDMFPEHGGIFGPFTPSKKFETSKLIVFLTARVHPGETPSSFSIKGAIDFLLDTKNPLSLLLRNLFVFKIIPMINPDGVERGHFRSDGFGRNLNRYYREPSLEEQPAVFAICQLINYFQQDKRIFFFCDMHAHGSSKNHFFYGNSLGFLMKVESKTFARILEMNARGFSYDCCDFTEKQMNAKEYNPIEKEKRTKEHCSRVATYRYAHLVHSFTLELGYHEPKWKDGKPTGEHYTPKNFEQVGRGLLISLLDLFGKNPESKIRSSRFGSIEAIRKDIADELKSEFRQKEANLRVKANNIHTMIEEGFYEEIKKRQNRAKETHKSMAPTITIEDAGGLSPSNNRMLRSKVNIQAKQVFQKPSYSFQKPSADPEQFHLQGNSGSRVRAIPPPKFNSMSLSQDQPDSTRRSKIGTVWPVKEKQASDFRIMNKGVNNKNQTNEAILKMILSAKGKKESIALDASRVNLDHARTLGLKSMDDESEDKLIEALSSHKSPKSPEQTQRNDVKQKNVFDFKDSSGLQLNDTTNLHHSVAMNRSPLRQTWKTTLSPAAYPTTGLEHPVRGFFLKNSETRPLKEHTPFGAILNAQALKLQEKASVSQPRNVDVQGGIFGSSITPHSKTNPISLNASHTRSIAAEVPLRFRKVTRAIVFPKRAFQQ